MPSCMTFIGQSNSFFICSPMTQHSVLPIELQNITLLCDIFQLVKPNIQVFRARFSEITPNSIRRACETLTEPDINISDAVDVRQELDLRIGNHFIYVTLIKTTFLLVKEYVWFTMCIIVLL